VVPIAIAVSYNEGITFYGGITNGDAGTKIARLQNILSKYCKIPEAIYCIRRKWYRYFVILRMMEVLGLD
jgi:hypothetical protein